MENVEFYSLVAMCSLFAASTWCLARPHLLSSLAAAVASGDGDENPLGHLGRVRKGQRGGRAGRFQRRPQEHEIDPRLRSGAALHLEADRDPAPCRDGSAS